jgi:5'-3' exonuclease
MGIPRFVKLLIKRYPLIEEKIKKSNPLIPPIDNLYLDINLILHLVSHSREHNLLALTKNKTNKEIFKETCDIINQIVKLIKPKSFLMIVLDGVCPIAKISNQIISRYVNNSLFHIDEFNELLKAINLEKNNDFDGNQIFPGTDFMNEFEEYLNNYVLNQKNEKGNIWNDIEVLISGTYSPGR